MRDSRLEELISAYVDGELSSDERMLVELQLELSSESRQLLEQLRRQRQVLQSLPRSRLSNDFTDRLVRQLEESKPVVREAVKSSPRRLALNVLLGIGSVLAAGLLITLVLRDNQVQRNPLQPPQPDLVAKPDIVDFQVRLAAFQNKFNLLLVYDLSITPKGRENNILDQWLTTADIKIDKALTIEEKMEQGLLESRYLAKDLVPAVGGAKDVSDTEVEMILIRATSGQLDQLARQWGAIRGAAQDQVQMNMDMAMTTKDLEIFLRLNDAVDGDGAIREVSSKSWTTPGTYKLKFRYAFNKSSKPAIMSTTASLSDLEAMLTAEKDNQPSGKQADAQQTTVVPSTEIDQAEKDASAPAQVLIITRNLNENVVFPATKRK